MRDVTLRLLNPAETSDLTLRWLCETDLFVSENNTISIPYHRFRVGIGDHGGYDH